MHLLMHYAKVHWQLQCRVWPRFVSPRKGKLVEYSLSTYHPKRGLLTFPAHTPPIRIPHRNSPVNNSGPNLGVPNIPVGGQRSIGSGDDTRWCYCSPLHRLSDLTLWRRLHGLSCQDCRYSIMSLRVSTYCGARRRLEWNAGCVHRWLA